MDTTQINKQNVNDALEQLAVISRHYGANPDYVIAGGGNTSFKNETTLWIKGSGVSLGEITPAGFVAMDRAKLASLWDISAANGGTDDASTVALREKTVLDGLMAARLPGEEQKRPSVETLLHDILPFNYVVHTHPTLVNGLTCSRDADKAARSLFGEDVVWIPISDPGFVLANEVRNRLAGRKAPAFFFLQNHGVFAGADTGEEIKSLYTKIMDTINSRIKRKPDMEGASCSFGGEAILQLQELSGGFVHFTRNNEIAALVKSREDFAPAASAYTPDHIVYAGSDPLFIEKDKDIKTAWNAHIEKISRPPKIVALEGEGVFGLGQSEKAANLALELFNDLVKVAVYSESFGGYRFMTAEKTAFINNWEAEHYRSNLVK
ncbi:MAG: class II aldolase/adducin family protein [Treponema sp.]|nr:class II aldolase/adducin family protein [Treponema sp.]